MTGAHRFPALRFLITPALGVRPFKTTTKNKTKAGRFCLRGPSKKTSMSTVISSLASRGQRGIIIRLREQGEASHRKRSALITALKLAEKHESQCVPEFVTSVTNVHIFIRHLRKRSRWAVRQRQHFPQRTQHPISDFLLLLTRNHNSFDHLSVSGPHQQTYKSPNSHTFRKKEKI